MIRGTMWTLRRYLEESRAWEVAVMATVPLFLAYELGLLLLTPGDVRNAAEVHLRTVLGLRGPHGMAVLNGVVLLLFVAALWGRGRSAALRLLPLVVLEAAAYALVLAPIVLAIQRSVTLMASAVPMGTLQGAVLGLGAGLYEELVFRLVLVAGAARVLERFFHVDPVWSTVTSVLGSSLLFSAFHHVGSLGEPWSTRVFVFRFLAGVILGLLFYVRGFAVVTWTHAIYDLYVVLD